MPEIDYRGTFDFDVAPCDLWDALERVDRFESWWPWLHDFTLDGAGLAKGSVLRGVVDPPLPYRMRLEVELVRCHRPRSIDAIVRGDLKGEAWLRLDPAPGGVRVEAAWTVEMMQRPMRVANRVARPLLLWGHDRVVDITVAGFRRNLGKVAGQSATK